MRPGELGFVGRDRDLAAAQAVLEAGAGGRGGLLLITGEAGMGKTRLAEEAVARARQAGFDVRWGTAWEGGGAPPFWPWVQALRDLPGVTERLELAALFGATAEETESAMAAEGARFRMFDAVAGLLAEVARERPLMVVLDDLHWADAGSLHLLAFVAPRLRTSAVAVVGTARDEELGPGLDEPMGALARLADRIDLRGLDNDAVDQLLRHATGHSPGASVAAAVRQRTAGNPFFVRELARLGDPQWQTWVPDSVGEVVRRRVGRLDAGVGAALEAASVLGQEFELDLVAAIGGSPAEDVADAMDAAAAAGLVREAGVRRWRFVHALARDALYDELGARRRRELHRAAGDELERRDGSAGEIALHLSRAAADAETASRAGAHALRAGRDALERLAPEQAVEHLRLAAELLTDESARLDALIALATALDRSGRLEACKATSVEAADLADRLGDARRHAMAVVAYKRAPVAIASGMPDPEGERLIRRALEALGPEDSVERALLLDYLARDIYLFEPAKAVELNQEALEIAERIGDPLAIGWTKALIGQQFHGHFDPERGLILLREAVEILDRAAVPEYEIIARTGVAGWLLQLGRLDELWRVTAEIEHEAERRGVGVLRLYALFIRAMRSTIEGRLDDAERDAREAFRIARGAMLEAAMAHGYIVLFAVAFERDQAEQTLPVLDRYVAEHPEISSFTHCMHVLSVAAAGDHRRSRALMARYHEPEFTMAVPVYNWTMQLAMLAEACMLNGDAERAAPMYEPLSRYSGQLCVGGFPTICGGPVDLVLGRLAALTGDAELAERHLRDAVELADRLGMPVHAGHARVDLSVLLSDPEPARRALDDARRLGLPRVARRAREALSGSTTGVSVGILGPLEVHVSGRALDLPALRSARSLLGLLATERRTHSRTELAERFWPGVLDESARTSLRTALATLRRSLGDDADRVVTVTRDTVALADGVRTDLDELDAAEPEEALALFRGPFLSGLDDDWVVERRDELRERAGRLHAQVAEAAGDPAGAISTIRAWVALDPLNEQPVRELMRRLDAAGDRAGALAAYERLSDRMREALNSAPGASTRALAGTLRGASGGGDVVTLLFTDVVGSTALLQRLGEDAGERLLRDHLDQVGAIVAAGGGVEVKRLGDGVMAAFSSAVDAVGAAIAIQRAVEELDVRIGINAGEPSRAGDDWLGTPVVIADRLCASAAGGQILTSMVVRGLVGGRHEFDDVGPLTLKGIDEPVPAAAVRWR